MYTTAVRSQLVSADREGYITTVTSKDFPALPHKNLMSIEIPYEVVQLADDMNGVSGTVRVVSFLYYDVEDLFPSGRPGDNGYVM